MARYGRLPGRRGRDGASRGASGGIKEAKGGQPARLGLWDKGREREDCHGRGDPGLACACVIGRVCVRVSLCGSTRSCPRPRHGWIRVWVDRLPGGCPNRREREGARSRATRSAGSSVCVSQALWLSTGAAWHPQECGFSRLPRPPPVPQGGGRQEKGRGSKGRNPPSPTRASNKGQFICSFTRWPRRRTGHQRIILALAASMPSASWAL